MHIFCSFNQYLPSTYYVLSMFVDIAQTRAKKLGQASVLTELIRSEIKK